jgi:hypothetical protein
VYLIHNIFGTDGAPHRKSIFVGLSAGLVMFFGVGWIASYRFIAPRGDADRFYGAPGMAQQEKG